MKEWIVSFVVPVGTRSCFSSMSTSTLTRASLSRSRLALAATKGTTMPSAQLSDFTGAAIQFFSSERVAAALIAGASLSFLFSLVKYTKDIGTISKPERDRLQTLTWIIARVYHCLCFVSVLLNLNVVVVSTLACTTLMLEKHNGLATNAYEFLFRELKYEFITTQWSFIMGLLTFVLSIATRAILEFDLLRKGKRKAGIFVVISVSTLVTHLLSYINSTLDKWPNLAAMTVDLFQTVIKKAVNRNEIRVMELLSLILGTAATLLVATQILRFDTPTTTSSPTIQDSENDKNNI